MWISVPIEFEIEASKLATEASTKGGDFDVVYNQILTELVVKKCISIYNSISNEGTYNDYIDALITTFFNSGVPNDRNMPK
jgi:hypothetical protein